MESISPPKATSELFIASLVCWSARSVDRQIEQGQRWGVLRAAADCQGARSCVSLLSVLRWRWQLLPVTSSMRRETLHRSVRLTDPSYDPWTFYALRTAPEPRCDGDGVCDDGMNVFTAVFVIGVRLYRVEWMSGIMIGEKFLSLYFSCLCGMQSLTAIDFKLGDRWFKIRPENANEKNLCPPDI